MSRVAIDPRTVEVGESPSTFFAVITGKDGVVLRSKHEIGRMERDGYLRAIKFVVRVRMMGIIDPDKWEVFTPKNP